MTTIRVMALNRCEYYENSNGVILTKDEYDIIIEAYGKNYFDRMSQNDYEWFEDLFMENSSIEINTYYDVAITPMGTSYSTANKKISIIKSCSTSRCTIMTTATWLSNPKVRSYDVIGSRFNGTALANNSITTRVQSSNGIEYFDNLKQYSNGFGVSVKLPTGATDIIIDQKFYVNPSGTVFASYQHATKSISLATSKLYTLGVSGYGDVFCFYGNALGVFDQMGGVHITL